MDHDPRRQDFRTVATALGADPDLALARAIQLQREADDQGEADVYLAVLRELCEGRA